MANADAIDPFGISTWTNVVPGLGEYWKKGGKILTYTGTRDPVCRFLSRPSPLADRRHR
jgi:hypothetical protein